MNMEQISLRRERTEIVHGEMHHLSSAHYFAPSKATPAKRPTGTQNPENRLPTSKIISVDTRTQKLRLEARTTTKKQASSSGHDYHCILFLYTWSLYIYARTTTCPLVVSENRRVVRGMIRQHSIRLALSSLSTDLHTSKHPMRAHETHVIITHYVGVTFRHFKIFPMSFMEFSNCQFAAMLHSSSLSADRTHSQLGLKISELSLRVQSHLEQFSKLLVCLGTAPSSS